MHQASLGLVCTNLSMEKSIHNMFLFLLNIYIYVYTYEKVQEYIVVI